MFLQKNISGTNIPFLDFFAMIENEFQKIGFKKISQSAHDITLKKGNIKIIFTMAVISSDTKFLVNFYYNDISLLATDMVLSIGSTYISVNTGLVKQIDINFKIIQTGSSYYIYIKNNILSSQIYFIYTSIYDIETEENTNSLFIIKQGSSTPTYTMNTGETVTINTILNGDSLPEELAGQTILIDGANPIVEINNSTYGTLKDLQILVGTEFGQVYLLNDNDKYISFGDYGLKID